MKTPTPERSVEVIEHYSGDELTTLFIQGKEWVPIQTLQAERQKRGAMVEDIIKMADQLEFECGKDGDKGTKQWMEFKGFRNTIRDKYLTHPNNK